MRRVVEVLSSHEGEGVRARLSCEHELEVASVATEKNESGGVVEVGGSVDCGACDASDWPEGLEPYQRTPTFTEESVPAGILKDHQTKAGVWARIHVEQGRLEYVREEPEPSVETLEPGRFGIVLPEARHRVRPLGEVLFHVEFWRRSADSGD